MHLEYDCPDFGWCVAHGDICIMKADGSSVTSLTATAANLMNADGSGVKRLTESPARDVLPAWSR